jgi:hypothetical protein
MEKKRPIVYRVKKGKHYSNQLLHKILTNLIGKPNTPNYRLKFKVLFENVWYQPTQNPEQINKLYGFSVGRNHHKYSVRVGYRPTEDKDRIEFLLYCYDNGIRKIKSIGVFSIDRILKFSMVLYMGKRLIIEITDELNDSYKLAMMELNFPTAKKTYRLFPYVGGKEPSKVDAYFTIEDL